MSSSNVRIGAADDIGAGHDGNDGARHTRGLTTPRPDPKLGVFETLLACDGEPVELAAHLQRLRASVTELYGQPLGDEAKPLLRQAAGPLRLGRLRLRAVPAASGLRLQAQGEAIEPRLLSPAQPGPDLHSLPLAGGLGGHKWVDRALLPRPGDDMPVLVDGEEVLEAATANVFVLRGGTLFTPPCDGRILPGTTRAAVLGLAAAAGLRTASRRLYREDLLGAEEVVLTSSVRGAVPARSLDGQPLATAGVSAELAARLWHRWRGGAGEPGDAPGLAAGRPPGQLVR